MKLDSEDIIVDEGTKGVIKTGTSNERRATNIEELAQLLSNGLITVRTKNALEVAEFLVEHNHGDHAFTVKFQAKNSGDTDTDGPFFQ